MGTTRAATLSRISNAHRAPLKEGLPNEETERDKEEPAAEQVMRALIDGRTAY